MYVDHEGDMILETTDELREFMVGTDCNDCRHDAQEMYDILTVPGKKPMTIVFSITCEHS